jgi:hypothetical protein
MGERPATRNEILLIGTVATAVGLYFSLVGAGALPIPGGPNNLHAPLWVVFCAGLAFLLAGVAILMHGAGYTDQNGALPAGAPQWLRVFQFLLGVTIFAALGAIASFIAFAPGPREFSGSGLGVEAPVSATIGRIAFGIGAIMIWLCTLAVIVSGVRGLFSRQTHP